MARKRKIMAGAGNAIALRKGDRPRLLRDLIAELPPAERDAIQRRFAAMRQGAAETRKVEHRRRPAK